MHNPVLLWVLSTAEGSRTPKTPVLSRIPMPVRLQQHIEHVTGIEPATSWLEAKCAKPFTPHMRNTE